MSISFVLISPLEVGFSQNRIAPHFQDGRNVMSAVDEIYVNEERSTQYAVLEHPFPCVDVIRWRAKVRDEAGKTYKVDGCGNLRHQDDLSDDEDDDEDDSHADEIADKKGVQFQSVWGKNQNTAALDEERWFAFDNRRLYCLQQFAARRARDNPEKPIYLLAREVRKFDKGRLKEIRKFRTSSNGHVVRVGHHDEEEFGVWDWRVGKILKEEAFARTPLANPDLACLTLEEVLKEAMRENSHRELDGKCGELISYVEYIWNMRCTTLLKAQAPYKQLQLKPSKKQKKPPGQPPLMELSSA